MKIHHWSYPEFSQSSLHLYMIFCLMIYFNTVLPSVSKSPHGLAWVFQVKYVQHFFFNFTMCVAYSTHLILQNWITQMWNEEWNYRSLHYVIFTHLYGSVVGSFASCFEDPRLKFLYKDQLPQLIFLWFLSVPPSKFWDSILSYAMISFFHILLNLLFTYQLIQCNINYWQCL